MYTNYPIIRNDWQVKNEWRVEWERMWKTRRKWGQTKHKIRILDYNLSIESIFIQIVFMITYLQLLHKIQKPKKNPTTW